MSKHHDDHGSEPPPLYAVPTDDWRPADHDVDDTPPHNPDAERAVLGAILLSPDAFHDVTATLEATDFYRPEHELIYDAATHLYAAGQPVDAVTVADALLKHGDLARAGGAPYLAKLISDVPSPATGPYYARIVAGFAARRRVANAGARITRLARADNTNDTAALNHAAAQLLAEASGATLNTHPVRALDIDTFLDTEDDETYDWVIPDFLEHGDRLIVTAGEGHGKSTLLRQVGIQTAAGIHPFTLAQIPPQRVLIVDLENSDRQSRRKLRPLRHVVRTQLTNPDNFHIICKLDGLDLTQPADELWLSNLVAAHRPDILITGPIYKIAGGNPNDEKDAKPAAMALDRIRATHDCALILEAHSKKAEGPDPKKRSKEPFGWSGWMRWPEFGLHLAQDGTLTHWRGMRDERQIPTALNRGGTWPWTPDSAIDRGDLDMRWHQIKRAIWQSGQPLSERQISDATGMSKTTVHRVLGAYAMQHQALLTQLEQEDR